MGSVFKNMAVCFESPAVQGPFKATQLWNTIISYLRQNIEVKKRRHLVKTYDECFAGSDAVSVVLRYLLADNINFAQGISRAKAIKLCQLLMDSHVFEPATREKDDKNIKFEDSHTKFYRFLNVHGHNRAVPAEDSPGIDLVLVDTGNKFKINPALEPDLIDGDGVISNPVAMTPKREILQEILNLSSMYRRKSTDFLKTFTPSKAFIKRASLPDVCKTDSNVHLLQSSYSSAILKEAALSKLLTLVDIPILDGIISQMETSDKKCDVQNIVIHNSFSAYEPFSPSRNGSPVWQLDPWIRTALDAMETLPRGDILLGKLQSKFIQQDKGYKKELFQAIVSYYGALTKPLISDDFIDVHLSVLNLLMQERRTEALELFQLSFVLMPTDLITELERLLSFIRAVCQDGFTNLSLKESNECVACAELSHSIINNRLFNGQQRSQLVIFMAENVDDLFAVPEDIARGVDHRLDNMKEGHSSPMKPAAVYCQQISKSEFQQQQIDCTESALVELMNNILDNTKFTLKEKQNRFKQFQKHHPVLCMKHFPNLV